MTIEKRKTNILFFNFQIKIKNWKLKKECLFSIFKFESKLKYTKIAFSILILKWKLNGTFGAQIHDASMKPTNTQTSWYWFVRIAGAGVLYEVIV